MTRLQCEREQALKQRGLQLDLVAQVEANTYPQEAARRAGFWLQLQAPEGQRSWEHPSL